ncbi:MAG: hypothetical protein COT00_00620 [Candidatus Omnitrophica bacterium CG07_land_8_20_14_0_80_50_8]|nr:MAG: hypothetical protein COT00_00620 [Candidatus Omnitrophica bacterium CG07_land_8_20_14_0_80_50_8]
MPETFWPLELLKPKCEYTLRLALALSSALPATGPSPRLCGLAATPLSRHASRRFVCSVEDRPPHRR